MEEYLILNMDIKPPKVEKDIEKAITMLVDCVRENCRNPKPLIIHSIRVGLRLIELKQPQEVIIAGILHDLVEDTNCTLGQIKKEFGFGVANLVSALSQEKIKDYKKRWHILLDKIKRVGKKAMLIKVVDIYENLPYLPLVKSRQILREIYWKHNFAMDQLKPYIGHLKIFKKCLNEHKEMFKRLKIE